MKPDTDKSAVDLIEEAVHLLRSAPLAFHIPFLIGSLPWCLGLLSFAAEMSWSAFAAERLFGESFVLAALFCWKQVWEAVYCARIHESVTGASERWNRNRVWRMISLQVALQPLSLLAIPIAGVLLVPFATVFAYFRNVSLYAGLGSAHALPLAREQAMAGTRQNWIVHSLGVILGLFLLVNYAACFVVVPQLAKSILGMENTVTRFPTWMFTSTGLLAIGLLTYVTLEPLACAVYVLRCFYGQSVHTGADVRASFRAIAARTASVALLAAFLAAWQPAASAQQQPPPQPVQQGVDAGELKTTVDRVMRRREYAWRMPKQEDPNRKRPAWAGWMDSVFRRFGEFWDWLVEGIRRLFESDDRSSGSRDKSDPWAVTLRYSLWVLGAVFAAGAAVLLYKQRNARKQGVAAAAAGAPAAVDLRDESVTADKLPESSWLALAQEWIDKGDLRLALRAMHLAGLSYLNGRSLVTIQRWKTGMEYSDEVARRGRSAPEMAPAFQRNLRIFEAGWYGRHEVKAEALEAYSQGLDEVRSHAQRL